MADELALALQDQGIVAPISVRMELFKPEEGYHSSSYPASKI